MKAIRVHQFGDASVLQYEDAPLPEPRPGEIRIKLVAAGLNFIDIYHRTGAYPLATPFTPGMEGAGTVDALGPGVADLQVGDRVAYPLQMGAYAEVAVVPADRAVRVPEGVDLKTAAAVMLQGMTAHYYSTSTFPLRAGDRALIHAAAGGVGLLLVQMAKLYGAWVVGTVSTQEKADLAKQSGADEVILYTEQDFESEVKRLTDGRGVDVVYDSVGKTTFDKSLNCLRPRGMMVLCGQASGPVPPMDPQVLNQKGALYLTRPTLGPYIATRAELVQRADDIFGWIEAGKLRVRIDQSFPLAQAAEAHRYMEDRRTKGKVLLIP
ncbi:MAG: quinone oxidoreductase [Caldilineaceae bacterium]|nr:quinone oxidoreductase [Caldilineaceae bacterium]